MLGFSSDGEFGTFLASTLIPRAQAVIDSYCQLPEGFFVGATLTNEYYNHKGWRSLRLRYYPIATITAMARNKAAQGATDDWEALTEGRADDFIVDQEIGVVIFSPAKIPSEGYRNVRISYVAGYTTTPKVIADITARIAAGMLQRIRKDKVPPETWHSDFGGWSPGQSWELSAEHKKVLDNFRQIIML